MKTYLECIPCFFKQALEAAGNCGAEASVKKKIIDDLALRIPGFSLELSPPEVGKVIHEVVRKHTGARDPYLEIKKKSNELALGLYDRFRKKINDSPDRLLMSIEMAIAGNVIDYGVKNTVNVEKELDRILAREARAIDRESEDLFDYEEFRSALDRAKNILYLGDNAGEAVFDRMLIEEITAKGVRVEYAVKERPIINDALAEDAAACGIDKMAEVISSGSDAPGTVLSLCSGHFLEKFRRADMVISKGQGNFEALSPPSRPIFFLFMAKCPVVVKDVGCRLGDTLLLYRGKGEDR